MFFSREGELRAFKLLAEQRFGPALLATLEDGRVEEFLEGTVSRSPFDAKCFFNARPINTSAATRNVLFLTGDRLTGRLRQFTVVQLRFCAVVP